MSTRTTRTSLASALYLLILLCVGPHTCFAWGIRLTIEPPTNGVGASTDATFLGTDKNPFIFCSDQDVTFSIIADASFDGTTTTECYIDHVIFDNWQLNGNYVGATPTKDHGSLIFARRLPVGAHAVSVTVHATAYLKRLPNADQRVRCDKQDKWATVTAYAVVVGSSTFAAVRTPTFDLPKPPPPVVFDKSQTAQGYGGYTYDWHEEGTITAEVGTKTYPPQTGTCGVQLQEKMVIDEPSEVKVMVGGFGVDVEFPLGTIGKATWLAQYNGPRCDYMSYRIQYIEPIYNIYKTYTVYTYKACPPQGGCVTDNLIPKVNPVLVQTVTAGKGDFAVWAQCCNRRVGS